MNKVLVVHLKRFGDLISAGQYIGSLKKEHPHAEVSVLCFEEFASVTKLIPGLKATYTINRNALMTLRGGKLYNNGFAIDELQKRMHHVAEQKWDRIINLTNDRASAYLCSWLQTSSTNAKVNGMSIDNHGIARASNSWGMVFNDIVARSGLNAPFNFRDMWAQMTGFNDHGASGLLANPRNEETVARHFTSLREKGGKIIGIHAVCSVADKGFSDKVICNTLNTLKDNGHTPLLLIAANDSERERANEILTQLDFKPIVVECDFTALSAVVKNLDLLITPDTVTKHFADAHNTPCLEVSLGSSPTFKQATVNPNSRLMIAVDRTRQVNASDITRCALAMLAGSECEELSSEVVLYRPAKSCGVTAYLAISGNANPYSEIDRHAMSAQVLKGINRNNDSTSTYAQLVLETPNAHENFTTWANTTKEEATNIMKDLLHTIRSLLQMRENPRRSSEFVTSLERLFAYTDRLSVANLGSHFFRARVESLPPANFNENARAIEALLFELKADIQSCLTLVNEWEKICSAAKFTQRKGRAEQATL